MNIKAWWKNNDGPAVHDLSRLEERMLGMEAEKDSLQLQVKILKPFFLFPFLHIVFAIQVNVLEDQIDGQTRRTEEVEKSLRERQAECRRLEELAAKERRERTAQELRTGELKTEVDQKPLLK